jgi:hypothetical protein
LCIQHFVVDLHQETKQKQNVMQVQITYTEIQYFVVSRKVEMTKKEYAEYLKTGKYNRDIIDEMSSDITEFDFDSIANGGVEIVPIEA